MKMIIFNNAEKRKFQHVYILQSQRKNICFCYVFRFIVYANKLSSSGRKRESSSKPHFLVNGGWKPGDKERFFQGVEYILGGGLATLYETVFLSTDLHCVNDSCAEIIPWTAWDL